jgi:hypothetical protein
MLKQKWIDPLLVCLPPKQVERHTGEKYRQPAVAGGASRFRVAACRRPMAGQNGAFLVLVRTGRRRSRNG